MGLRDVMADFMHVSRVHLLLDNPDTARIFRTAAGLLIDAPWGYDERRGAVIPSRVYVLEVECKLEGGLDPAIVRKRLYKINDVGLIRVLPVWPRKISLTPQGFDVARDMGLLHHAQRQEFNPHYRRARTRGAEPDFVMRG